MTANVLLKELVKEKGTIIPCIITLAFVGSFMYVIWMGADPEVCKSNNCVIEAWSVRLFIISMPVLVSIMVIRIFREDPKDQTKEKKKEDSGFDYSKMGANSSNDKDAQEKLS